MAKGTERLIQSLGTKASHGPWGGGTHCRRSDITSCACAFCTTCKTPARLKTLVLSMVLPVGCAAMEAQGLLPATFTHQGCDSTAARFIHGPEGITLRAQRSSSKRYAACKAGLVQHACACACACVCVCACARPSDWVRSGRAQRNRETKVRACGYGDSCTMGAGRWKVLPE